MNFLDPKIDIAFKKILGNKQHKHLTISFLNNILNLSDDKLIKEITFLETELQPERIKGKKTYFDIYCTDQQNREYIIEIQLINEFNFIPRSEYYAARALALQLHKGKDYQDLVPVIFVGVVNYNLFDELDDDQVISSYSMHNNRTGKKLKKTLTTLHYVELTKFNKTLDQLQTATDRWLYFFKFAKNLHDVPQQLDELHDAFTVLDELQWSHQDLQEYSKEQETLDRERRQQQGSKEEGREEGREQGKQEGEKKAKIAIAVKMIQENLSVELIAQLTNFSIEEIIELQKDNLTVVDINQ